MKFSWKDTLRRMTGSESACPICRADGLVVTERDDRDVLADLRGIPYCECVSCKARGDFAEMVATASEKSVEDAVRELKRLGELEASARDIDTYVSRKNVQVDIEAHLAKCVDRLRSAPHLCGIRAGMSVANMRQLPSDTGLHVQHDAPPQFAILSGKRYAQVPMTLYRYRFDGETSCIDAQNPKTLQREHRIRVTGDVGVYLGNFRFGEMPQVVLGTHNPRAAGQIYGAMRAESSLPPPVVGIAGFPLPHRFCSVSTLYLLDCIDVQLPLSFAVRAISSPVVYGSSEEPRIRVLSPRCQASDITAADVRQLSDSKTHGVPIREWLVEKILAMGDRHEEIANALLHAGASENVRAEIVELLGPGASQSLVETIMLPTTEPDDVFTLGNGKIVKNTPVGIYTARRNVKTGEIEAKNLLCNVGITVDSRIVDRGFETACCTVRHADSDIPAVTVRIPKTHWNNPDAMAEDIRSAYAEHGRTPYVSFYKAGGYCWFDVMQFLGSRCPVQTGIRALGVSPDGVSNLPGVVLGSGKAAKQTKASLLDQDTLLAYSAITDSNDNGNALYKFLGTTVTLERVGIAAGVLHTVFCAAGKMFDASGVRRPPAHLLFVETEPGVWDDTIRTLEYLFSGSEYVPLLDYGDKLGFLHKWSGLGTLPLITRLPSANDMATVLASSPISVIAVVDPLTAVLCSGTGAVSFVLPNVESGAKNSISHEEISELRGAFSHIVAERVGTSWLDVIYGGSVSTSTPCLSVLGAVSDLRDAATVAGGLYRSVKSRYPGVGMTGARAFFAILHREYTAMTHGDPASVKMTIVTGAPADTVRASFNERGEHVFVMPDMVLVSRSIVQLINKEKSYLFDVEQLSHEFNENGIILNDAPGSLGIDERRVWVFPRSVWDSEVVRAAGFSTEKEKK